MRPARVLATWLACVLLAADVRAADPRGYGGPTAVAGPERDDVDTSAPGSPPAEDVAGATVPPPRLQPAATPVADAAPSFVTAPRSKASVVGAVFIAVTAAGWVATVIGLSMGEGVDDALQPLRGRDDLERRRDLLRRGALANRLAIGAGIAASVSLVTGIVLMSIGRRRERRAAARRG